MNGNSKEGGREGGREGGLDYALAKFSKVLSNFTVQSKR
jgi:hypothetical protein